MRDLFRKYYLFFGIIALGTLVYDTNRNLWQLINHYSTFTILTVAIAAVFFIYIGLVKKEKIFEINIDAIRGAVVSYLLAVSIIYELFLAKVPDPNSVYWINLVMHRILPAAGLLGWIIFPPQKKVNYTAVIVYTIFPIGYFVYLLVRGAIVGWYPYYFFDPTQSSYFNIIILAIEFVIFGAIGSFAVIAIGNLLHKFGFGINRA